MHVRVVLALVAGVLGCLAAAVPSVDAANIVAVHGLLGFGPKELLGVGYWGFWNIPLTVRPNYLTYLEDWQSGWKCGCIGSVCFVWCSQPTNNVFYAQVGPVSSNWDRACELYAQIMGTRTDYGYWHSKANQHSRWGPDYTGKGFLPNWSANNKISLVGHSQGGQTIRWLEWLMQKGADTERVPYPAGEPAPSPLFTGSNRNWIKSLHSIAAVHGGSPLATALGPGLVNALKDIIVGLGSALSFVPILGTADWGYDFMLDQFGISRRTYSGGLDAGFKTYFNAVLNPSLPLWSTSFTDLASYEMTPRALWDFNAHKTQYTYPGTYYFSHTTSRTRTCGTNQCSDFTGMEIFLAPTGAIIGSISQSSNRCNTGFTCSNADFWCQAGAPSTQTNFCYDDSWEENDGLVPFKSSISPFLGVPASQYHKPLYRDNYNNNWQSATWYYRNHTGTASNPRDHVQIVGLDTQSLFLENGGDGAYQAIAAEVKFAWAH